MEFIALIVAVIAYQWILIPITKKKIGYIKPDQEKLFYDYKTKWQLPFEIITIVVVVLLVIFLTSLMGIGTVFFIPLGLIIILIVRGILEKKYASDMRHHVISFINAIAIFIAFAAILIMAIIVN